MIRKLKKDNLLYYSILILIAILMCIPLFINGFFITHDGTAHFSRNYATIEAIKSGQLLPEIVSNFCGGFGYSWNLFYPPLSTYINAIFYLIIPDYIIDMKLLIIFTIILASIFMFQFIKDITKNKKIALIVSTMYITSIYFITNIYVRLAIGEIMVYVFMPLLFNGLYNIFYEKGKKNYLLTIGAVGILLSHNISSLILAILSIIIILCHYKKLLKNENSKQILKDLFINAFFIILIVSFFMIPLLEHKLGAEYIAMVKDGMTSRELVVNSEINLKQIIMAIGFTILIPLLLTPICYKKIKKEKRYLYITILIIGIVTSLISTKIFPWNNIPDIFLIIQFPWRMLLYSTFFLSIIAGINISICVIKEKNIRIILVIFITIIYRGMYMFKIINFDFNFDISYLYKTEKIENIYAFSQQCTNYDYLPVKARTPYIQNRENKVIILNGNAKIKNEKKEKTNMQFYIETFTQDSIIELPYIYYLGYNIKLNNKYINYEESENGFISIKIPKNTNGKVEVKYTGTKLSKISLIISIIGIISFIVYIIYEKNKFDKFCNKIVK